MNVSKRILRKTLVEDGRAEGWSEGKAEGKAETIFNGVEAVMQSFQVDLQRACEGIGITLEEYQNARRIPDLV